MVPHFEVSQVVIPTGVVHAGSTVRDAFAECVTRIVPGIPFCDSSEKIIGRVSVRHVIKMTCIPDFMVKGAHLLGDRISAVRMPDEFARQVLALPVDPYVIEKITVVNPAAMLIKALAMMEQDNTAYAFVIDDDGKYLGVVSRRGIASLILEAGQR